MHAPGAIEEQAQSSLVWRANGKCRSISRVNDITIGDLTGVVALMGAWGLAALFGFVAVVLTVVTGVTEKRSTWGRSALAAWALAIGLLASGYASLKLPHKIRDVLDETMYFWVVGVAALGGYTCFRAGRRM